MDSQVSIISGPHKGLDGKVVAVSKQKQADSFGMSAEKVSAPEVIDQDAFVSVQLKAGGSIVQVKRKRLSL